MYCSPGVQLCRITSTLQVEIFRPRRRTLRSLRVPQRGIGSGRRRRVIRQLKKMETDDFPFSRGPTRGRSRDNTRGLPETRLPRQMRAAYRDYMCERVRTYPRQPRRF